MSVKELSSDGRGINLKWVVLEVQRSSVGDLQANWGVLLRGREAAFLKAHKWLK